LGLAGSFHFAMAKAQSPLLMPGKKTLYQRMLSRPEAKLYSHVGANRAYYPRPFTVFYVYDRKVVNNEEWASVGLDKSRGPIGWVSVKELIEWRQTLTVAFRDPLGRDRSLLFRDRDALKDLIDSRDMFGYNLLYRRAAANEVTSDSPVIAIQPKAYVDILQDFYLVPILEHEDIYIGADQGLMLKIASLPLEQKHQGRTGLRRAATTGGDYRAGIVFVIDSTISMGPYINRTRAAVKKVFNTIEARGLKNKVSFGLVAYRDNIQVVPKLEYLTRTYATLGQGVDPRRFFEGVNKVAPARVSSQGYVEDAYAGIKQAVESMDWNGFNARYLVLITDAGARTSSDPLGRTGMNAEALSQLAQDKGLSIWVLHLLTPAGKADHAAAAEQYQRLSLYPGIGDFYYPVELGSVTDYGQVLETFATQITEQVREAVRGVEPTPVIGATKSTSLGELERKLSTLGYALRMRYLQKAEGGQIPSVFNAWLVDRDIANPDLPSVEVRVLLTRDQLSDLQFVLKKVLETAEEGVLSPRDFLDELKSVAATISRDPTAASASTRTTGAGGKNLVDLGYMREYIEDLPYSGEVMKISLETWEEWPAQQQLKFIHNIESKINYYQTIHDNTDLWVSLDGGPITGEAVIPIALRMLP
jgi:hypothetical protein